MRTLPSPVVPVGTSRCPICASGARTSIGVVGEERAQRISWVKNYCQQGGASMEHLTSQNVLFNIR